MLDWIIQNKAWLFSGILVAVPIALVGWHLAKKKNGGANRIIDNSIHQSHSGIGPNIGRDQINNK